MSALEDWYMGSLQGDDYYEEELLSTEIFKSKMEELVKDNTLRRVDVICPMQLMTQMNGSLIKDSEFFVRVINLQGVFKPGNGILYTNGYYYDTLKDLNSEAQIKIVVPALIRQELTPDSLVVLNGMVIKRLDTTRSCLEFQFRVDNMVEEVKSKAISDSDMKLISLIQKKNEKGKKPVKAILKNILMRNERPKVYIIYAQTTITDQDFEAGVKTAASQIDFYIDKSVSFANTAALVQKLKQLDVSGTYHAICLVRGGGSGMEKLDDVRLFECLTDMETPVLGGVGHVGEGFSIKSIVDENVGTPSLLGQYFDNLVKDTAQEREGTLNNLAQKMEAKYKPHMDRLLELEKSSKADKEQINKLLNEKQKDVTTYVRTSQELSDAKEKLKLLEQQLADVRNNGKAIWIVIAVISIIALLVVLIIK